MDRNFACPDWFDRLKEGRTPIPDLDLNEDLAQAAVAYLDKLRLPDRPGQPTFAEAGGDWVRDIVRAAFGSLYRMPGPSDSVSRLVRGVGEIFLLVPKKNGKTTNAAAIGILCLLMNRTPYATGVIIGPTIKAAQNCFNQAAGMIRADPYLERRFKVIPHEKRIVDLKKNEDGVVMNASLEIKAFDLSVVTGMIPAFAIVDELHDMAKNRNAERVIEQIRGGMVTTEDSLLIFITTQSDREPSGAFKAELNYARKVRDGEITEGVRMLPVLYEFPEAWQLDEAEPWRDPDNWGLVLPNLGRSVFLERQIDEFTTAEQKGREQLQIWLSQHLNIQIGLGFHEGRWIGAEYWEQNGDAELTLESLIATSDVAVVGGDIGGADDLFGMAVIGRHRVTRHWQVWVRAWALESSMERRPQIAGRLRDFEAAGDLVVTDMSRDHVEEFVDICDRLKAARLLPAELGIGLDAYGAAALTDELVARSYVAGEEFAAVAQGYKLSGAIKGLERRLSDGTLRHGRQDLLTWMVGNARAEIKGNNVYITKEAAGVSKIDCLTALFNAAMLMDRNPAAAQVSPFDDPEFQLMGA